MQTTKVKLQFADKDKNTKILTVDYPKTDLTADDITHAMDQIVESNILTGKDGPITQKIKAYKETIDRTEFNVQ